MPMKSRAQNRFFRAHERDKGPLGKVAREFVRSTKPGSVKRLPERKGKPRSERWYGSD